MFRPNSDAIQIGSDQIKIPCRNGLEFTQDEEIVFDVPRNSGMLDLQNAYLECDITIGNPNNTATQQGNAPCLTFDKVSGAQSCINQLTIRSEGRLIEQLANYNVYSQVHYNATEDEGILNKRTRLEGCAKSYDILDNPFVVPNKAIISGQNLNDNADCWKYVTRKVCLPLLGGIFTSPKVHPAMAVPLTVSILLEKAERCLRLVHGGGVPAVNNSDPVAGAGGAKSGEHQMPINSTGNGTPEGNIAGGATELFVSNRARFSSIPGQTIGGDIAALAQGEQYINPIVNFPYKVGQTVRISGHDATAGAAAFVNTTITQIEQVPSGLVANQNHIKVTVAAQLSANDCTNCRMAAVNDNGSFIDATTQGSPGYRWNNPRLIIPKVVPPPSFTQNIQRAIQKGSYSQDIISYSVYKNAIPPNQSTSTNIIPADLSRCKAILSVPLNQENQDNVLNSNALCGQYLSAENYQYSINNRLVPDRRVDLVRESFPELDQHTADEVQAPYQLGQYISGFHIHETQKALENANIRVRNLRFITLNNASTSAANGNLGQSSNRSGSWLVSRSLGAGEGTNENLVGKSVLLYLNYQTNPASDMTKLLHNFVTHIRTIQISMAGVQIFY